MIAQRIFSSQVLLLSTVIQEAIWVLSRGYQIPPETIVAQLSVLIQLPSVVIFDDVACRWALARYAEGADFADMLHLALSGAADMFATFDKGIAQFADDQVVPVETL